MRAAIHGDASNTSIPTAADVAKARHNAISSNLNASLSRSGSAMATSKRRQAATEIIDTRPAKTASRLKSAGVYSLDSNGSAAAVMPCPNAVPLTRTATERRKLMLRTPVWMRSWSASSLIYPFRQCAMVSWSLSRRYGPMGRLTTSSATASPTGSQAALSATAGCRFNGMG